MLALGLRFSEVPTTITDHIRSAIVWVPHVGGMALLFFIYELAMRRVEGGKTEDEIIASSSNPKFTKAFRASADALIPIIGLIAIAIWLFLGTSYSGLYLAFIMLWGFLSVSVVNHARMGHRFNRATSRLFIITPIFAAIIGSFGYTEGERLLSAKDANWEIAIEDGDRRIIYQVAGVRRFDSVVIAVDMQKQVWLYPAASVVSARYMTSNDLDVLNGCRWFGILCTAGSPKAKAEVKTSSPPPQDPLTSRHP